jgi:RsmE family RNA methyltransferase
MEGAMQGRDTVLPSLEVYDSLAAWLKKRPWDNVRPRVPFLIAMDNVRPEGSLSHLSPGRRPVVLAIGPERGWSDRERGMLEESGFLRLSMGGRALRTETACVAAVAVALEKIGELE